MFFIKVLIVLFVILYFTSNVSAACGGLMFPPCNGCDVCTFLSNAGWQVGSDAQKKWFVLPNTSNAGRWLGLLGLIVPWWPIITLIPAAWLTMGCGTSPTLAVGVPSAMRAHAPPVTARRPISKALKELYAWENPSMEMVSVPPLPLQLGLITSKPRIIGAAQIQLNIKMNVLVADLFLITLSHHILINKIIKYHSIA